VLTTKFINYLGQQRNSRKTALLHIKRDDMIFRAFMRSK